MGHHQKNIYLISYCNDVISTGIYIREIPLNDISLWWFRKTNCNNTLELSLMINIVWIEIVLELSANSVKDPFYVIIGFSF